MVGRAGFVGAILRRSRFVAIVIAVLFLHALAQPQVLLRQAEPPTTHVAIDNCDGGPTGCKVLPFAQFMAQAPSVDRRMEPPPPFAVVISSEPESRYEAPLRDIEWPPRATHA